MKRTRRSGHREGHLQQAESALELAQARAQAHNFKGALELSAPSGERALENSQQKVAQARFWTNLADQSRVRRNPFFLEDYRIVRGSQVRVDIHRIEGIADRGRNVTGIHPTASAALDS
ncbi:hypothetical protein ACFY2R_26785 [Micromonospora olivasterospora]|uniref:hypothetical protein n=1 Tax=Micromonospora olivasterospora TaxID=1880 RepID=UPI00119EDE8B|nr:hypothetical protein [Micromonospora olivasterospora]